MTATPGNWFGRRAHEWRLTTNSTQTPMGKQPPINDWLNWRAKQKTVHQRTRRLSPWVHHRTQTPSLGPPENPSEPFPASRWVLRWDTNRNHSHGRDAECSGQPILENSQQPSTGATKTCLMVSEKFWVALMGDMNLSTTHVTHIWRMMRCKKRRLDRWRHG
jgi:hypothetical protein